MTMEVRHLTDPAAAARELERVALDPVLDTVLLSVLDRTVADPDTHPDRHWWLVEDRGDVVGVAFRTAPHPLGLALEPGPWLRPLVEAVLAEAPDLDAVASVRRRAEAFAAEWVAVTGGSARPRLQMRILECVRLDPPADVPGAARAVRAEELTELAAWVDAFADELALRESAHDLEGMRAGARWWVDRDERVSLAVHREPSRGVARVGPVYTPRQHRRRGYAAAVTAAVTRAAYDAGADRVVLYTDAANPTSNAVYERIGYRAVAEAVELDLARG